MLSSAFCNKVPRTPSMEFDDDLPKLHAKTRRCIVYSEEVHKGNAYVNIPPCDLSMAHPQGMA